MFSEIEQQYYASADLFFLFYHGLLESVAEVTTKALEIVQIRPQALVFLLRNVDIGSTGVVLERERVVRRDFDAKDSEEGLNILKEAIKRCLQLSEKSGDETVCQRPQHTGCSLL